MLDVDHIAEPEGLSATAQQATSLTRALFELREEHRLKDGIDFAMTSKYGHRHVLCADVFKDSLQEVFAKHGVAIATWHTYKP